MLLNMKKKEKKREQVISLEIPRLIDTLKSTYIIPVSHKTLNEKETVDEIIFRTVNPRNRLMLELMARGAMRVGEVLKIVPNDISELVLPRPTPK